MKIEVSPEMLENEKKKRKAAEKVIALAEKIAKLVESEEVTVDAAERALHRAEVIVRTRTIVGFTCP